MATPTMAKTPIEIDNSVNPVRSLFEPIDPSAISMGSVNFTCGGRPVRVPLLCPERFDGIQAGGANRRYHPSQDTDNGGDGYCNLNLGQGNG